LWSWWDYNISISLANEIPIKQLKSFIIQHKQFLQEAIRLLNKIEGN